MNTNKIHDSEQEVLNQSFDPKYNVLGVELMAENAAGTALNRLKADESGNLNVNLDMATEGIATSAKQDLLLTELQQKTEPDDIQNTELVNALRALLQAIAMPMWYDPVTNTLKVGTHAVTVSSGTITTLTNQTNFGSNAADVMTRDTSINTWANVARRTIT